MQQRVWPLDSSAAPQRVAGPRRRNARRIVCSGKRCNTVFSLRRQQALHLDTWACFCCRALLQQVGDDAGSTLDAHQRAAAGQQHQQQHAAVCSRRRGAPLRACGAPRLLPPAAGVQQLGGRPAGRRRRPVQRQAQQRPRDAPARACQLGCAGRVFGCQGRQQRQGCRAAAQGVRSACCTAAASA